MARARSFHLPKCNDNGISCTHDHPLRPIRRIVLFISNLGESAAICRWFLAIEGQMSSGILRNTSTTCGPNWRYSCHPTGAPHHLSIRVPLYPVWQTPVARFPVQSYCIVAFIPTAAGARSALNRTVKKASDGACTPTETVAWAPCLYIP
jgi:hypothetical protein